MSNTGHKPTKCTINVDKGIAPIVQYIMDRYPHGILPYSSCEGGDELAPGIICEAFIALVVRGEKDFHKLMRDLDACRAGIYYSMSCTAFSHDKQNEDYATRTITLNWNHKYNSRICRHIKKIKYNKLYG